MGSLALIQPYWLTGRKASSCLLVGLQMLTMHAIAIYCTEIGPRDKNLLAQRGVEPLSILRLLGCSGFDALPVEISSACALQSTHQFQLTRPPVDQCPCASFSRGSQRIVFLCFYCPQTVLHLTWKLTYLQLSFYTGKIGACDQVSA